MSTYIYQLQNDQQWCGFYPLNFDPMLFKSFPAGLFELLERDKAKPFLTETQVNDIKTAFDAFPELEAKRKRLIEELQKSTLAPGTGAVYQQGSLIFVPSHKPVYDLAKAYKLLAPVLDKQISNALALFETLTELNLLAAPFEGLFTSQFGKTHSYQNSVLPSTYHMGTYADAYESHTLFIAEHARILKSLKLIQKKYVAGELTVEEKHIENSVVAKKSWAIFMTRNNKSGFRNKAQQIGDISSAVLYDSSKAAYKAATNVLTPESFDIVEVDIQLKKRTHLNENYQSVELAEALTIIEKNKLQALLDEYSIDELKHKLELLERENQANNPTLAQGEKEVVLKRPGLLISKKNKI